MGNFYDAGLKFECTGCRYCCSCEPGFVFLTEHDANRLAHGTGLALDKFIELYCRKVDMGIFKLLSLKEKDNYDCIFLSEQGCSVYHSRPEQCRTYPFWSNVLEDKESWDQEAKGCPGIGKGKLYSKQEIEAMLARRSGQEPMMFFE